eukprot:157184_1
MQTELAKTGKQNDQQALLSNNYPKKRAWSTSQVIIICIISICVGVLFSNLDRIIDAASSSSSSSSQSEREYRSYSGVCNNKYRPMEGARHNIYSRGEEGAEYTLDANGIYQSPVLTRPNPRIISNSIGAASSETNGQGPLNGFGINLLELFFGQFINHDLQNNDMQGPFDLNLSNLLNSPQLPVMNLSIDDPLYNSVSQRNGIPQLRNFNSTGYIINNQFEITNNATGWMDLSTIYGSDETVAFRLREFVDGKLITRDYKREVLFSYDPFNTYTRNITLTEYGPPKSETLLKVDDAILTETEDGLISPESTASQDDMFTFGDKRGTENAALLAMQTVFLREHNRICDELKERNPSWNDEKLYQEARRWNIAKYQKIVMYDYLSVILGDVEIPEYDGYNSEILTDTSHLFSTVAFRYGHSSVTDYVLVDECLRNNTILYPQGPPEIPFIPWDNSMPFAGQLGGPNGPAILMSYIGNLGNIVRSILYAEGAAIDIIFSDSIRNADFQISAVDIMSSDIHRGRLHGIPNYNEIRKIWYKYDECTEEECDLYYGIDESVINNTIDDIELFNKITSNETLAIELQSLYSKVNNIDAIIGLFVEDKINEERDLLPPTMRNIILSEYIRKRDGDRFWYENDQFSNNEMKQIKDTNFKTLLERNLQIENLPENVFYVPNANENGANAMSDSCVI